MTARTAKLVLGVVLLARALPLDAAPVPRMSPELSLLDSSGNEILLSSFRGKVVLVEFLLTNCPHCSRVAQTVDKIQRELDPRGFQAVGVAIEAGIRAPLVTNFVEDSKIVFPVRYASSDQVDRYLGRAEKERFQVPQLVLIDREGVIRAQSRPVGENLLETSTCLRKSIEALLKEGGPSTNTGWTSQAWMNSGRSSILLLMLVAVFLNWMNQKRQKRRATSKTTSAKA
jgi:peroxiredoxin